MQYLDVRNLRSEYWEQQQNGVGDLDTPFAHFAVSCQLDFNAPLASMYAMFYCQYLGNSISLAIPCRCT